MREAPHGLDATQVLTGHILYSMSVRFEDYFMYEMCRRFPLNKLSMVWGRLTIFDEPQKVSSARTQPARGIHLIVYGISRQRR